MNKTIKLIEDILLYTTIGFAIYYAIQLSIPKLIYFITLTILILVRNKLVSRDTGTLLVSACCHSAYTFEMGRGPGVLREGCHGTWDVCLKCNKPCGVKEVSIYYG